MNKNVKIGIVGPKGPTRSEFLKIAERYLQNKNNNTEVKVDKPSFNIIKQKGLILKP